MIIELLAAAEDAAPKNSFGFVEAMKEGGPIAWSILGVMIIMSVGSFYIMITKLLEQRKVFNQYSDVSGPFWRANSLKEGATKLIQSVSNLLMRIRQFSILGIVVLAQKRQELQTALNPIMDPEADNLPLPHLILTLQLCHTVQVDPIATTIKAGRPIRRATVLHLHRIFEVFTHITCETDSAQCFSDLHQFVFTHIQSAGCSFIAVPG